MSPYKYAKVNSPESFELLKEMFLKKCDGNSF